MVPAGPEPRHRPSPSPAPRARPHHSGRGHRGAAGRLGTDLQTFRARAQGRQESSWAGPLSWDKGPILAKGERRLRTPTDSRAETGRMHRTFHAPCRDPPTPGATTAPDSPAPGVLGRCPTPGPAGSAARGSAAAGPTSAARMRRLFSSVQRSERTAGCARSSSAAASTQPAVHAAQASSAPRPHQPHRPRRQHRRGRLRAMTRRPRPDPPPAPRALPAAPRLCAAQRGRGRGGEAALGEGEALRPDCPRPARSGGGVGWSGRWPHPARPPGHGGKGCPLAAPGDRSLLALSTRRTPLPFPLFFFFTFSPKKTSSPS